MCPQRQTSASAPNCVPAPSSLNAPMPPPKPHAPSMRSHLPQRLKQHYPAPALAPHRQTCKNAPMPSPAAPQAQGPKRQPISQHFSCQPCKHAPAQPPAPQAANERPYRCQRLQHPTLHAPSTRPSISKSFSSLSEAQTPKSFSGKIIMIESMHLR